MKATLGKPPYLSLGYIDEDFFYHNAATDCALPIFRSVKGAMGPRPFNIALFLFFSTELIFVMNFVISRYN